MNRIRLHILLFFLFIGTLSFGEEVVKTDSMLLSMSFEELLDVEIITASKYREDISKSSANVTILSRDEIENIGANNLFELIDRLPSTYALGSFIFPQNTVSIRGDLPTHLSAHFLILVNGRPFRESGHMGMNSNILTSFPVQAIERIEFVRGPGSVLYGSNAYSGVINIITRRENHLTPSIGMKTGSFGTYGLDGAFNISKGEFSSQLFIQSFREKGWRFTGVISQRDSLIKDYNFGESNNSIVYQADWRNLKLNSYYGHGTQDCISATYLTNHLWDTKRWFNNISYDKKIGKIETQSNLTYNWTRNEFRTKNEQQLTFYSDDILGEVTAFYKPTNNTHVVAGGLANFNFGERKDHSKTDSLQQILQPYQYLSYSFYLQADHNIKDKLKLVLGIQANKNHNYKMDFVPRIGLVLTPIKEFGVKVSCGQAFRSPSASELDLDLPPLVRGNPDLEPEKITTFDAQVFVKKEKYNISVNYFNSVQSNLIGRVPNSDPNYFSFSENLDTAYSKGVEVIGGIKISNKIQLNSSFIYQENSLVSSGVRTNNASSMPNTHFKIGGYYEGRFFIIGVFNHFIGRATEGQDYTLNGSIEPYNYLTAKLTLKLDEVIGIENLRSTNFYIYGVNLLNEEIKAPELFQRSLDSVPSRAGFGIYFGLDVSF